MKRSRTRTKRIERRMRETVRIIAVVGREVLEFRRLVGGAGVDWWSRREE